MIPSRLFAGLLLLAPVLAMPLAAAAQTPQAASPQPPAGPGPAASGQSDHPPPIAAEQGEMPVFGVTAVEVLEPSQIAGVTMIVAKGVVSSAGWQNPSLIPLVRGTPPDGVLDLVLVAQPPSETMPAAGFVEVQTILSVDTAHPYRAVRVRAATNVIAVRKLPGHAEAAAPQTDCHACIGHRLAAAGAATTGDEIAAAALPAGTRVLRPEDGLADLQPNPNRLTVLLGDDGRITEAVWQ